PVDGLARGGQGLLVDVGAVDLDRVVFGGGPRALGQEDGDGVRLLAGRAARAPDPEAPRVCRVLHEPWDHVLRQHLPGLRVAEEAGHVDEDRVDERDVLAGVLVEQAGIGRDRLRAHLRHARTDSPDERDFLVLAEVEVVLRAQLLEQLAEVFAELGRALTDRVVAVAHVSSPAGGATRCMAGCAMYTVPPSISSPSTACLTRSLQRRPSRPASMLL